jgi:hypothetical protein
VARVGGRWPPVKSEPGKKNIKVRRKKEKKEPLIKHRIP